MKTAVLFVFVLFGAGFAYAGQPEVSVTFAYMTPEDAANDSRAYEGCFRVVKSDYIGAPEYRVKPTPKRLRADKTTPRNEIKRAIRSAWLIYSAPQTLVNASYINGLPKYPELFSCDTLLLAYVDYPQKEKWAEKLGVVQDREGYRFGLSEQGFINNMGRGLVIEHLIKGYCPVLVDINIGAVEPAGNELMREIIDNKKIFESFDILSGK